MQNQNHKNIADNLKRLRSENEMTQSDLAQVLHTTEKTISHWETGYSEPSVSQLINIADYFDISLDELVGRKLI